MNTLLDICRNVRMLEKIRQIDKISRMILCRFRMGRTKMIVMVLDVFMEQLNIMFLIGDWRVGRYSHRHRFVSVHGTNVV